MTHDTLQFRHSDRPPAGDLQVFDSLSRELLGATFRFRVVGSSHYVSAPAYDFHELSSCEPLAADDATTVPLAGGDEDADAAGETAAAEPVPSAPPQPTLTYENDHVACETVVERRPLAAFPAQRSFDLSYRFEPEAYTTIDLTADGYETYHTYPEFDLAVYTRTAFTRVDGRPVEAVDRPSDVRSATD